MTYFSSCKFQEQPFSISKIRSRNTKFEENFVRELRKKIKIKFKLNYQLIKGKPDIVFNDRKVCVFLDSDFWHGWQYPRWKHLLKNNFWRSKIETNRKRDRRVTYFLRRKGWNVVRLWEHGITNNTDGTLQRIKNALVG